MLPTDVPEYRVHTTPSRIEHWRHLVEIVALIAAAVWAFYVFVYQEKVKPAGEPAYMQFSSSLAHEPLPANKELVTITINLKNTGSNDIAMAALITNAYGVRYADHGAGKWEESRIGGVMTVNDNVRGDTPALLYSHLTLWAPLGAHRDVRLPKSEVVTLNESFVIERGQYDTVRLTHAYCYQRYDNQLVTAYQPRRSPDAGFDIPALLRESGVHAGLRCGGMYPNGGEYAL